MNSDSIVGRVRAAAQLLCMCAVTVSSLVCLPAIASAQSKGKADSWRIDPYTSADPAAMARAGVVKYGPLSWADDHDTTKIDAMMPEAKILWLETKHFRIGSTLPLIAMPKASKAKRRLSAELKALKKLLPGVKPKTKKLSRWLRLHMYAQRLEKLYADCQAVLHVTDADFPKDYVGKLPLVRPPAFMGLGPYLGMGDKLCVLMLNKPSNLMRYSVKSGQPQMAIPNPIAIHFFDRGSLLFGTSPKFVATTKDPDYQLQAHVQFNMTMQLLHAFRHYSHGLPAWVEEGFANSLLIEQHPSKHSFSGMQNWDRARAYPGKWNVNSRRLAHNDFWSRGKALSRHQYASAFTFNDQVCSWSRVDYLRSIDGGKKFAKFMHLISSPMPALSGKAPEFKHILAAQDAALQEVFSMTWEQFDEAWKDYALSEYPRK